MTHVREVDNRTAEDVIPYLEARIEALAERVQQLEAESARLRAELCERVAGWWEEVG